MAEIKMKSTGVEAIAEERRRQIEDERWSLEHDDRHVAGEMAMAAACYALESTPTPRDLRHNFIEALWPWADMWWKPKDRRHNLARAGALIAAEIERLDRRGVT